MPPTGAADYLRLAGGPGGFICSRLPANADMTSGTLMFWGHFFTHAPQAMFLKWPV